MRILITGAAGFIGFHLAKRLLIEGNDVTGFDNLSDYYEVTLKEARLEELKKHGRFKFIKGDLEDRSKVDFAFDAGLPEYAVHLAAQAGVRYSLENPRAYIDSNIVGFLNILEACRQNTDTIKHLIFASSSSVYGGNTKLPFSTGDRVDSPISLYAATKKSNELMAHAYSHLFKIPSTGLRFFTVYGPWGRPDMAAFTFTEAILKNEPVKLFNHGKMMRDFTYIDDIVAGVVALLEKPPAEIAKSADKYFNVYNIGNNNPVELEYFVGLIEKELGRKAAREYMPMQPGDVPATYADISDISRDVGFAPQTTVEQGIREFVKWYKGYYKVV
ncbi:MAG: NAD-dependent epimerase [Clostridiales bacterium]|nr:NAD-dependent epimerase [Clostridiales bacterium]